MKRTFISALLMAFAAISNVLAAPPNKLLILDNDLLIEGDIRLEGDQYHVKRGMGETIIPASRVIDVVADLKQAYRVMVLRCNRRDFDDRMRVVRWCMENGLRGEALAEAESLLQFRPDDIKIRRLVNGLRDLKTTQVTPPPVLPPAKLPEKVLEVEPLDYNHDAYAPFISKVQPILMNACVGCHATGQGGSFNLVHALDGGDRKASAANLAAVLKQVKRDDLAASPLLQKAIIAHGKAHQPPLHGRDSPAYQRLEAWIEMAVPPAAPASGPSEAPQVKAVIEQPLTAPKTIFGETSTSQVKPEPQTTAKDPFDPAIFNGTIVPKKD